MLLYHAQRFTETLEMHDLSGAQEPDGIDDVGILRHPQDVVVGGPRLLLRSHILRQVGDGIALALEFTGILRDTACRLRPYRQSVVDIVGTKVGSLDLLRGQIAGELVNDGGDHFEMGDLNGTWMLEMDIKRLSCAGRVGVSAIFSDKPLIQIHCSYTVRSRGGIRSD